MKSLFNTQEKKDIHKVETKFKEIYIGKIIQQKVDERGLSYAEFARKINCARTSLYHIFNSKNIDIERLLLISEILQYDFIGEVYLKQYSWKHLTLPYIILPINTNGIDISCLPQEIIELLKREFQLL